MKTIRNIIPLFMLLIISGFTRGPVAQGETNCRLGSFIIEKSGRPLISDGRILKTYDVKYENSALKLRIGVDDSKRKNKKYIVVSDDFAVQYGCKGNVFGAARVEPDYIEDGIPETDIRLNRIEYYRQKVLTQIPKSEIEYIKLISVYFPKLIDSDVILANN